MPVSGGLRSTEDDHARVAPRRQGPVRICSASPPPAVVFMRIPHLVAIDAGLALVRLGTRWTVAFDAPILAAHYVAAIRDLPDALLEGYLKRGGEP